MEALLQVKESIMFRPGDIVKVQPNWLDKGENPDTLYVVLEDYGDGKVKVFTKSDRSAFGGYVNVWPDYTVYKVGHECISPDGREQYEPGEKLYNGKYTLMVVDVDDDYTKYRLVGIKPASIKDNDYIKTIAELHGEGYQLVK